MSQLYTFTLLSLECIQAQEFDGDEPYLTLNDARIWEVGRNEHMHPHPKKPNVYASIDFASGQKLTRNGWEPIEGFNPSHYVFPKRVGEQVVRLYEADRFGDDYIASASVTAADSASGAIKMILNGDGASYRLTYKVELE